jgi:hypothetical protein
MAPQLIEGEGDRLVVIVERALRDRFVAVAYHDQERRRHAIGVIWHVILPWYQRGISGRLVIPELPDATTTT